MSDDRDEGETGEGRRAATGRRVPLATVVIATLLSVAIAALVAGLLLGVGE